MENSKNVLVHHLLQMHKEFVKAKMLPEEYQEPLTDMSALLEVEKLNIEMFGFLLRIVALINKQYPQGEPINENPTEE